MKEPVSPGRALWPMGLAACLSLFGDLTLYAVLITELDAVGLTLTGAGIMLGVNRLVRIPGNPLAGIMVDRWGRRRWFVVGMVLGVASTAAYGLVRGFWPFLLARLAWGMAWTVINVGGMSMVIDVSTRGNRGRWMGILNTWVLVGLALGPIAGGLLVDQYGFQTGMLACAAITFVGLGVAIVSLPETLAAGPGAPRSRPSGDVGWVREWWRRGQHAARALGRNPGIVTASLLYLIVQFSGDGVVLSTLSLLLQRRFGEELTVAGLSIGIAAAGGLGLGLRSLLASLAGPIAGYVSDTRWGRWPVIAASLAFGIAGFAVLACATQLGSLATGLVLGSVGAGMALATLAALVGDLAPSGREGAVMGAYATAGDIGSTGGPFLAFALLTVVDLRWIYLFCSLTFVFGLGLIWNLHGRKR